MTDQTRHRAIILGVVVIGIIVGLIWPFALDNTKRMKDAEKAAETGETVPADR